MIKNYFINLGKILKDSIVFFAKNFVKNNLLIILLIAVQMLLATPLLYFANKIGYVNFSLMYKIIAPICLVLYFLLFIFMFKKIFKLASVGFEKQEIANSRLIKSLLILGLLNCTPLFAFLICYGLALIVPNFTFVLKIILNIFTYIFYFIMCLSVSSVVFWQDKNIFIAILKSIKVFCKKIQYTIPVYLIVFALATLVTFVLCSLTYAIAIKFGFIDENFVSTVHAVVNLYSIYVFAGFYIGTQVNILKDCNE